MMGLRNLEKLEAQDLSVDQPWSSAVYQDGDGRTWHELDMSALVMNENFLNVGA
jgi:hypothetical protein